MSGEFEVGSVTYYDNGLFLWDTGSNFLTLVKSAEFSVNSPKFTFAGANWSLSVWPDWTRIGGLGLSLRNEARSSKPRLYVNLGIDTAWGVKENRLGETSFFGDFNVRSWLQLGEMENRRRELTSNRHFIIFCRLQNKDTDQEDLLWGTSSSAVLNSESVKVEKEDDYRAENIPRLSAGVVLNSESEKEEKVECREENTPRLFTRLLTLSDNLKELFQSGEGCDITLLVKEKELRAHSAILQARSKVFFSMLSHDMTEKNSREIKIEDCDPGAFHVFLHFLYTGKVEGLTDDNMLSLYYIADKYEAPDLKSECVDFIKRSVSVKVVCEVILLASRHTEPDLLEHATEYFIKNIKEILETVHWQNFLKEHSTEANELFIKALKKIQR